MSNFPTDHIHPSPGNLYSVRRTPTLDELYSRYPQRRRVIVADMVRRRTEYDALQPTRELRWLVVRATHGRLLKSRRLPPGTHLQREFVASIIAYIDEGWTIGDFSSRSACYVATKLAERIEITISATDPHLPLQSPYANT